MVVFSDVKSSVQAGPTRLCCEKIVDSVFTLPEPLLSASYYMSFVQQRQNKCMLCCSTDRSRTCAVVVI